MMRFGSVCSGIEAASVAWGPLGWRPAWLSEIEPFPCALLAHHYPETLNLGDMMTIRSRILSGEVEAPELFTGGTPCQAFSVAGARGGLSDERGALSLEFCEIGNAIDAVRLGRGEQPCIIVWENVPGVLSSKDNAFGCFLAGLAGEDLPLEPAGGKWANAGAVFGPQRAVAWRVLDAQYFGLAQRRRRVFVVASARDGFDPCAVLFEFEGVRRDTAPSREAGQDVAGSITASLGRRGGQPDCGSTPGLLQPVATSPGIVAHRLNAGGMGRIDYESETFVVHGTQDPDISVGVAHPLGCNQGQENAVFAIQAGALRQNPNSGPDGVGVQADHAYTLEARAEVQAVCITGDITHTLKAEGFDASEDGTGRGQPIVSVALRGRDGGATAELGDDIAGALRASGGGGDKAHALVSGAVRRLTPRETERLQGFPDDYTLVPVRGKPAADGPRYKAIGNSWAVPVVRWIGERIKNHVNSEAS